MWWIWMNIDWNMQDKPNMDGIDTKEPTTPPEPPNLNLNIMLFRNAKLDLHWHAHACSWS
jgi:hypothetical protein